MEVVWVWVVEVEDTAVMTAVDDEVVVDTIAADVRAVPDGILPSGII